MKLFKKLCKICKCKRNENLSQYCSIKIGGNAKYVCFPKSVRQVKKLVCFLSKNKIKYYILGNGTNTIFEDGGFNGAVICLKKLNKVFVKGNAITAYAGANLFYVNQLCAKNSLKGLEFSYGIPASVGGAISMNAGAFGGEMKDVVKSVLVLQNGHVKMLTNQQIKFSYRHSCVRNSNLIVLRVCFKLSFGTKEEIEKKQKEIMQKRLDTQPYGTFNAGSIFKRTENESAGKYIDKLGLKGVTIGNIQISHVHANFFINLGGATSEDLHKAISFAKQKVLLEYGINLHEEVIFVGD